MATLIGDVVQSRTSPNRSALHAGLVTLLDRANAELAPVVPLRITVGDEFQGCFATLGEALHATLWLRLHLSVDAGLQHDLRHGVGWGRVAILSEVPRVEDGPGWWAARKAIETVKLEAGRAVMRHLRTAYIRADEDPDEDQHGGPGAGPDGGPDGGGDGARGGPDAVNAALLCRDQMVGSLSERSLRLLRGTLDGTTQVELAEAEGISASAVSQRIRNDGLAVIVAADELLRRVSS